MSKPQLRVAVAGTGYFSGFHFDAWARCDEVELVGIASHDEKSMAEMASRHGIEQQFSSVTEMLDVVQPDILDIITPPHTHLEIIEEAARRGIHAICQKPFCGDLETAKQAADLADEHGIKLIVHENFRFQPWYQTIASEIVLGRLGRIYNATFRLRPGDGQGANAYLDRQPYFRNMPRFLVHETAIHLVDVARYLLGEPKSVSADLARLNPEIAGEDSAHIVLGYDNGMRAIIDGNRLSDHVAKNRRRTMGELMIEGENGTLRLDGEARIWWRSFGENTEQEIDYEWQDTGFGGDCVFRTIRHIVDHFVSNKPVSNTAHDYLKNLEIEEAIYAASDDGMRRQF